ncbi:RTX calcium-binding nonapeptide repeat (4 copies) [compost metagenome]
MISSVSRVLGANQEKLTLSGSAAINGTGNGLANTLTGNAAANVLNGSTGADTMVGGLGNDTYYVDNAADVVSETSATGGIDTLISSVSRVLGANQEKLTLSGTAAANATGNALANTLTGNAGNNQLNGGAGNDTLSGGAGNDRLTGGTGKDSLIGGTGNDTFFFGNLADMGLTSTTWDLINDFTRGADRIDLSALDANTGTLANDAFSAVIGSTSAFTAAGQLKFNGGVLYGNTDADTAAEFAIQLTGVTALSTADFIV